MMLIVVTKAQLVGSESLAYKDQDKLYLLWKGSFVPESENIHRLIQESITTSEHDHDHDENEDLGEPGHNEHDEHLDFSENSSFTTKLWGLLVLYTLAVNLTSLTGVITLGTTFLLQSRKSNADRYQLFDIVTPGFAAGTLLATAFLLILPASLNYIKREEEEHKASANSTQLERTDDHSEHPHAGEEIETEAGLKFGLALLCGFFIPLLLGLLIPSHTKGSLKRKSVIIQEAENIELVVAEEENYTIYNDVNVVSNGETEEEKDEKKKNDVEIALVVSSETEEEIEEVESNASLNAQENRINYNLAASILIGDGFHNYADGIFIGIALMNCTNDVAIGIIVATVFHELAQELADFVILTKYAGLNLLPALGLNFVSGLLLTCGGITALSLSLTENTIGIILAMSAGVYINISATECIPRMEDNTCTFQDRCLSTLSLSLGVIAIVLVSLNHQHCG